jgi:diketogulonate reductase-like aldo/keto reductase
MDIKSTKILSNGVEFPCLGLGVWRAEGDDVINAIKWAVEFGYRHIDTAAAYFNEKGVGKAIKQCGIPREELFITTKLWNADMRSHRQMEAFENSLKALCIDYIDLYLIHWPVENFVESWKVMEKIYDSGRAKAVGVSNFHKHHFEALLETTQLIPAVNQFECHPYLSQEPLIEYCKSKGTVPQAYCPIGGKDGSLRMDPVLKQIGGKYGKSPAQIALRWNLQRGLVVIPKSVNKERIKENCDIYDFELSGEDMAAINALNRNERTVADPDNFDF